MILVQSCEKKGEILNEQEKAWLQNNPDVTVSLYGYLPPYQFARENGYVEGVFVDYLSLIEEKIGYEFNKVAYPPDQWTTLVEDIKANKTDIILEIQKTKEREEFLRFYDPLFKSEVVLISRKGEFESVKFEDIVGLDVVVPENYMTVDLLHARFPDLKLNFEKTEEECLTALNDGKYDIYIGIRASSSYFINHSKLKNLEERLDTPFIYQPSIAVSKKQAILGEIMEKAIKSIPFSEKETVFNGWLLKKALPIYHLPKFWFSILAIIATMVAVIIFFNFRLKKLLDFKTKELRYALKKAEESDQLKTNFINNISHEVRTPMNGILGYSELLHQEASLNGEHKDYLKTIMNSGKELVGIIDNIIEISDIESDQTTLYNESIDLPSFFQDIVLPYEKKAVDKGVTFAFAPPITTMTVVMDKERLKTVIGNIIDNAIKYTNEGKVEFGYHSIDTNLILEVSDTGIGIGEKDKEHIFERFYQQSKTNKEQYGGLGLGLAIAKENIKVLKGDITFQSKEKEGSLFEITIPFQIPENIQHDQ